MLAKLISALYEIKDGIKRYLDKHEQEVEDAREEGYNEGYDEGYDEGYNNGENESQQGATNYPLGFIPPDAIIVYEGSDQYTKFETYQEIYDYVNTSSANADKFANRAQLLYKDNTIDKTKCPYGVGLEEDGTANGYFFSFHFDSTINKIFSPSPIQGYYILEESAELTEEA